MKKFILFSIITMIAIAFISCESPKYTIFGNFTQVGERVEMTENNSINDEWVTIGWLEVYGQSGNFKDSFTPKKEPKKVETNENYIEVKNVISKNWRSVNRDDLTKYADEKVKEYGGDALVNVKFDIVGEYSTYYKRYIVKYITMRGEVVKKRVKPQIVESPIKKDAKMGTNIDSTKYYNLRGEESENPFDGVNVVVKTYTDGTKSASKEIL